MKNYCFFDYPIGRICISSDEDKISGLYLPGDNIPEEFAEKRSKKSADSGTLTSEEIVSTVILEADSQLTEYFEGTRKEFNLPLKMTGTDFQKSVWEALLTIPYGETRSYKEIAVQIGNEKACRAVGMANNRNPIAIIVPCHRVIGHNGTLVGYGGGLELKQRLLDLEQEGTLL